MGYIGFFFSKNVKLHTILMSVSVTTSGVQKYEKIKIILKDVVLHFPKMSPGIRGKASKAEWG